MWQRQGVAVRGIGLELLRHRKKSDKTLEQVAGQLGVSISTLSRLENGKREPTSEEVAAVLAVIGVTGAERDRLIDLARGGHGSSGMVEYSNPFVQSRTYLNFEAQATVITNFQPLLVPGLAHTSEYAHVVISTLQGNDDKMEIEAKVRERIARRAILTRKRGPRLNMILTELGLRQPIGGAKVMARQVRYLTDLADLDNVSLRVIPLSVPTHPVIFSPFVLLEFPSHPTVAYSEARTTGLFRDDPEEVAVYRLTVEKLTAAALDKAGSVELLRSIARDLDRE